MFHHDEAMRDRVDGRTLSLEEIVGRNRLHKTDLGYTCTARLPADRLVATATSAEELQSVGPSPIHSGTSTQR